jgi:hypothetical protein
VDESELFIEERVKKKKNTMVRRLLFFLNFGVLKEVVLVGRSLTRILLDKSKCSASNILGKRLNLTLISISILVNLVLYAHFLVFKNSKNSPLEIF